MPWPSTFATASRLIAYWTAWRSFRLLNFSLLGLTVGALLPVLAGPLDDVVAALDPLDELHRTGAVRGLWRGAVLVAGLFGHRLGDHEGAAIGRLGEIA